MPATAKREGGFTRTAGYILQITHQVGVGGIRVILGERDVDG